MQSVNPATGAVIAEWSEHDNAEVERRLGRAQAAFSEWKRLPFADRGEKLLAIADQLEAQLTPLAATMTEEMGKPIVESEGEVAKCAWVCRHYATHAAALLEPTVVQAAAAESFVRYDPIGPILAIMPWNFPYWQVFRFAAPALMAGNVLLIKHAPNTQGCAEHIIRIAEECGLPAGCLQLLRIDVPEVADVIGDTRIAAVTLTGSDRAGRSVAALAGQHLKPSVLELGGSDPFIVLADADLDITIAQAVKARCLNTGQTCCAAKRFIVERPIAETFIARFSAAMGALIVGNPMNRQTQQGSMARADLLEKLHQQVEATVLAGATVTTGGHRVGDTGHFYAPTVLIDVPPDSPAAREELFGPVAAVFIADDVDEAVRLANDTEFGLAASVWSEDRARARALVPLLDAGAVFINKMPGSDPRLPFGGVKASGYGRELGLAGIREFVNVKTVCID